MRTLFATRHCYRSLVCGVDVAAADVNSVISDDGGAPVRLLEEAVPQGKVEASKGHRAGHG